MKKQTPAQLEAIQRLMQMADTPQNLEAMQYVVFQFDFRDFDQFIIECPPGSIRFNNLLRLAVFCDNVGFLVESGVVDREAVFELFPIPWAKVEPVIQGMRKDLDWPDTFDYFERLGREYMKWWEAKRKRLNVPAGSPELGGIPRSLFVAKPRPPAPARPASPPRPGSPSRAAVPAPAIGRVPQPALPVAPAGAVEEKPKTLRVMTPSKAVKVVSKEKGGPQARPKAHSRAAPARKR
ncbi:MAG: hypothetical protein QME77_08785 [bacterium]|nr:hypothetical protein [bacterium]